MAQSNDPQLAQSNLIKEHSTYSGDVDTGHRLENINSNGIDSTPLPEGYTLQQIEVQLKKLETVPSATLLIAKENWQLVTDQEAATGKYTIIGRCEIGIEIDDKTKLEQYYFKRVEVDLTNYPKPAGQTLEEYFLTYMKKWLRIERMESPFRFSIKPRAEILFAPFPKGKFKLIYVN